MKIYITLFFLLAIVCFPETEAKQKFIESKANAVQFEYIKDNYTWKDKDLLIVLYRQPQDYCHYNQYKEESRGIKWFKKFISQDKTENAHFIQMSYGTTLQKVLNNEIEDVTVDKENFFFNNFFGTIRSCFAVMVINTKGEFVQKNGEFSHEDIKEMVKLLKDR